MSEESRETAASPRRRRFRYAVWPVAALSAAAALAGGYWYWHSRKQAVASVAVMPFVGLSPVTEPSWLCEGLTAEVIDALERVPGLRVAGPASVFALDSRGPHEIAARLGVMASLEASVQVLGERVVVAAQLMRVPEGRRIWTKTFERPLAEFGAVAGDLARGITTRAAPARLERLPNLQGYNAYLQGRFWLRRDGGESRLRAADRFERATEADPRFAAAWAWLAIARESLVEHGIGRPNEAMPAARDAAERAAAIEPDSGVAHAALGIVRLQYDWKWMEAKREFDRALAIRPGSTLFRLWMGRWFDARNRRAEAIGALDTALALDPFSAELRAEKELVTAARSPGITGQPAAAAYLDEAETRRETEYVDGIRCASLAIAIEDWNAAFDWLEWAYNERSPAVQLIRLMRVVPRDSRVEALAAKMDLPASGPAR